MHPQSREIKSQVIESNCQKEDPREPFPQIEMNNNSTPTPLPQVGITFTWKTCNFESL